MILIETSNPKWKTMCYFLKSQTQEVNKKTPENEAPRVHGSVNPDRRLGPHSTLTNDQGFQDIYLDVPGRKWSDQWLGSMGYA